MIGYCAEIPRETFMPERYVAEHILGRPEGINHDRRGVDAAEAGDECIDLLGQLLK